MLARPPFVTIRIALFLAALLIIGALISPLPAHAAHTFVVNQTGDASDFNIGNGHCDVNALAFGDQCTLRAAIQEANADVGTDTITFSIGSPTFGTQTITPGSPLPTISDPVSIDGTTQPQCSTYPCITIKGTSAGASVNGLDVTAGSSTIKGLVITNFGGDAIKLETNGSNVIAGNYIGIVANGATAAANANGIELVGSLNNTIGGTSASTRNIISGNSGEGIFLKDNEQGNVIEGNYIGTNATGTAGVPNSIGIDMQNSFNNTIGGTSAAARNVISGNIDGIFSRGTVMLNDNTASGNLIEGNYIGTDVSGAAAIPNTNGVYFYESAGNILGGTSAGTRNVISGNSNDGVYCNAASVSGTFTNGDLIEGNFIGTDASGAFALANGFGVAIVRRQYIMIGGTGTGAGNLISGNSADGIWFGGDTPLTTTVQGNFIGTDVRGMSALPNTGDGIDMASASTIIIGGITASARNLISGNDSVGVFINGSNSTLQGNFIGTNVNGTAAMPNGVGVVIQASSNTIGGTSAGARNLVSGNFNDGIQVADSASANLILGNYVGTDVNGTAQLANGGNGVHISGSNNTVGGTSAGARNVIAGNDGSGIVLQDSLATNNMVQGNFIGLTANGSDPLGNALNGIFISGPNNTVGGANARNIISANGRGVYLANTSGNLVQNNYIGTDASGLLARGNAGVGTRIESADNNTILHNVISNNDGEGIDLPNSNGNIIQSNLVGIAANGKGNMGNNGDGILLDGTSSHNTIGGTTPGAGNKIGNNHGNGVTVGGTVNDMTIDDDIRHNSIFSNTQLGIDLGDNGVTKNDVDDGDSGPNNLQNYPILSSATGTTKRIEGKLHSTPNTKFILEFFSTKKCDASGFGEGKKFLGLQTVMTNGSGNASFSVVVAKTFAAGQATTATATDPHGNTSEFSKCRTTI